LYMRGVFFVLFCLTVSAAASAVELSGELTGAAGPEGFNQSVYLSLHRQMDSVDLRLGVQCDYGQERILQLTPRWQLEAQGAGLFLLRAGQNVDHYTSSDLFRLINKNQRARGTSYAVVQGEQLSFGLLGQIPLRSQELADALFVESVFTVGPLAFTGLQLRFLGPRGPGAAAVLQVTGSLGAWEAAAAAGWVYERGQECRGTVFELRKTGSGVRGGFSWQSVDPGFESLFAKSNRYTPNRVGWELNLTLPVGPLEAGMTLRRHTDAALTRRYDRLLYTVQLGENVGLEWRLEPTRALAFRYSGDGFLWQFDAVNQVLRHDRETQGGRWSFRADGQRKIFRIELQLEKTLAWRCVFKYDFSRQLAHHFLRVRWGTANRYLQLELGEYDGGNLAAAFGQPPKLKLSWSQRF